MYCALSCSSITIYYMIYVAHCHLRTGVCSELQHLLDRLCSNTNATEGLLSRARLRVYDYVYE